MFLAIKNKENRNEIHKTMINTSADVKCKERLRKPGNKAVSVFSGPFEAIRIRFVVRRRVVSSCFGFRLFCDCAVGVSSLKKILTTHFFRFRLGIHH